MELQKKLELYTKYLHGLDNNLSMLEIEDVELNEFDFTKYDLNNGYFGGVKFISCDFTNVYLSGSNFGGSQLNACILYNNSLVKAEWDDVTMSGMKVKSLNAFRSSFIFSKFVNCNCENSNFESCNFAGANFDNVIFEGCNFKDAYFNGCTFNNVIFKNCIIETDLEDVDGLSIVND